MKWSFDSESSGSGSDAGEASDTHAGSPVEWPIDPSGVPMDVDDYSGTVGGTGMFTQASAGGDGAPAVSAAPPRARGQTNSHPRGSFCPGDAVCARSTSSSRQQAPSTSMPSMHTGSNSLPVVTAMSPSLGWRV